MPVDFSPIANSRPFRLGDAITAGQTMAGNQFRLNEQQDQMQAKEGLRGALQAGTPEAMETFSKQHPEAARAHKAADTELQGKQLNFLLSRLNYVDHIMSGVSDENSYKAALPQIQQVGVDTKDFPQTYDPNFIEQRRNQALGFKGQAEIKLKQLEAERQAKRDAETNRHNQATEKNQARTAAAAEARAKASGDKAPSGYRTKPDGTLEAIPGGPATKPSEAQEKQLNGVQNLKSGIEEYRSELKKFTVSDLASPDARARMGTKYNNMLLQAKEAYNLGVLNGPDYQILQSVITDPRSFSGAITSKKALDEQAVELSRIMTGIGTEASKGRYKSYEPKTDKASQLIQGEDYSSLWR
jgi:hypothetical protein